MTMDLRITLPCLLCVQVKGKLMSLTLNQELEMIMPNEKGVSKAKIGCKLSLVLNG